MELSFVGWCMNCAIQQDQCIVHSTYIYNIKIQPDVGKSKSPMDPMGFLFCFCSFFCASFCF